MNKLAKLKRIIQPPQIDNEMDWTAIDALQAQPRPKNSFTSADYAKRYKLSPNTALSRLRELMEAGKIERCGSGNQIYYMLKKS